jgi:hypothetical protein
MLLTSSLSNGCLLQLQEPYLQVGKPQFVTFKKLMQNEPEKKGDELQVGTGRLPE